MVDTSGQDDVQCPTCLKSFTSIKAMHVHRNLGKCRAASGSRSYIKHGESVSISIPGWVLKHLDGLAGVQNVSRSLLVYRALMLAYAPPIRHETRRKGVKQRHKKINDFGPGDIFYDTIVKEVRGF